MQEQERGIKIDEFLKEAGQPADERNHPDSELIATSHFNLNGAKKLFELNKETLEIKPARIRAMRVNGKFIRVVECKKATHRYVAAKNYSDAEREFVRLLTDGKVKMKDLKKRKAQS
jgi:hypothetical protein